MPSAKIAMAVEKSMSHGPLQLALDAVVVALDTIVVVCEGAEVVDDG